MKKKYPPPYQVRMDADLYKKAVAKARSMGLSFAAYVRMLVSQDTKQQ
jgi:antitoxin component of RelBE/YafQ-DinJ toxin-antitoxin module